MRSTMMDVPLTIASIMRYGTSVFGDREVVTCTEDGVRRRTYAEAGRRAARLANALRRLGVDADQRVGTFMWNNAEHLEAYLAVPSMAAVLHTLNIRLAPAEVGYIATHADDYAVIVDASLVSKFAEVLPYAPAIKHVIRMKAPRVDADGNELGGVPVVLRDAPLGTYLGWNITAAGFHKGQACNYAGGMIPFARTKAGASVMQANRVTTRATAMAGPLLRYLPKSAKYIIPRPQIVVMALPTRAWPIAAGSSWARSAPRL